MNSKQSSLSIKRIKTQKNNIKVGSQVECWRLNATSPAPITRPTRDQTSSSNAQRRMITTLISCVYLLRTTTASTSRKLKKHFISSRLISLKDSNKCMTTATYALLPVHVSSIDQTSTSSTELSIFGRKSSTCGPTCRMISTFLPNLSANHSLPTSVSAPSTSFARSSG